MCIVLYISGGIWVPFFLYTLYRSRQYDIIWLPMIPMLYVYIIRKPKAAQLGILAQDIRGLFYYFL